MFTIISYTTNNGKYLDYAKRLKNNFDKIDYYNYEIVYFGRSVNKNEGCLLKPTFILSKLFELQNPVLYIDVDSQLTNEPKFDSLNCDIGFVFTPERKNIITDSIHFWNYSNHSIDFLRKWKQRCDDKSLKSLDHHRLIDIYNEYKDSITNICFIDLREQVKDWFIAEFSNSKQQITF